MPVISLIGFPDNLVEGLMALSAHLGFEITRQNNPDEIPKDAAAAFVCGDRAGWLENICEVRSTHSRMFLVIATRRPDHEKWLDALEAGANDYCCTPIDARQFAWLLRRDLESKPAVATAASLAS